MNTDLKVFIFLHDLETKMEQALEVAASSDDVAGFKNRAKSALNEAWERFEKTLSKNPRSREIEAFIQGFLKALEDANTVEDPSAFFSTLYAEMRTRR